MRGEMGESGQSTGLCLKLETQAKSGLIEAAETKQSGAAARVEVL